MENVIYIGFSKLIKLKEEEINILKGNKYINKYIKEYSFDYNFFDFLSSFMLENKNILKNLKICNLLILYCKEPLKIFKFYYNKKFIINEEDIKRLENNEKYYFHYKKIINNINNKLEPLKDPNGHEVKGKYILNLYKIKSLQRLSLEKIYKMNENKLLELPEFLKKKYRNEIWDIFLS